MILEEPWMSGLPGEPAIRKGLQDFASGKKTLESLLIQIGASRLRSSGIPIEGKVDPDADYRLYELLESSHGDGAFSQYNAWIRQLVSFERALENIVSGRT
jgi:hypothetical protein